MNSYFNDLYNYKFRNAIGRCKRSTSIAIFIILISIIVAPFYSGLTGLGWTVFVAATAFVAGGGSMFLLMFDKDAK